MTSATSSKQACTNNYHRACLRQWRLTVIASLMLVFSDGVYAQWFQFAENKMTTQVDITLWHTDEAAANAAAASVFAEFERIEELMSRYIEGSELSQINRDAGLRSTTVSEELLNLIARSIEYSEKSQGAFDITFASVGYLYDFRKGIQPEKSQLKSLLEKVDYRHIKISVAEQSIYLNKKDVVLDLGGIAKGYAVDQGIQILRERGIKHARIRAGGDMYMLGDKLGKPWIVAVQDPRNQSRQVAVIPLVNEAISTSGDYQRYFINEAGERVHHILAPKTGESVKGLTSVSVLGPDTVTTDALSTSVFILGREKGIELIDSIDGVEAIVIDDQARVYFSRGLARGAP